LLNFPLLQSPKFRIEILDLGDWKSSLKIKYRKFFFSLATIGSKTLFPVVARELWRPSHISYEQVGVKKGGGK